MNGKLLGWRKMIAAFGAMAILLGTSLIFKELDGDQWVAVVDACTWIALGLMGGNALTHIAQAFKK
jgi:hypothetical protein